MSSSESKGCPYIIKDNYTDLYLRLVESDHPGADVDVELTSRRELATRVMGYGYALNTALSSGLRFTLERDLAD